MTNDRNNVIDQIQDLLGSEGSRELAERVFDLLRSDDRISYDSAQGLVLDPSVDLIEVAASLV